MKIQSPPGMRDFYPDQMRVQNWLFDAWRSVSRSFGFQEYEGPIFEFLDLFTLKSGDEIASQLFRFEDRGGRQFAIRPEMTPTLARMVAARANSLSKPIKWFSIPRMCRAEKPQRGRLREFFQWNVDVLGSEDPLADAEVIAVAVEFLRLAGLEPVDVAVRISHRPLIAALLESSGVPADKTERAFELLDRRDRQPAVEFENQWSQALGSGVSSAAINDLLSERSLSACCERASATGETGARAAGEIEGLWQALDHFGVADYCEFDPAIVRGLAYYTGTVFEVHPKNLPLRALLGGGRYDDLTGLLDGPRVPGVGFGMGDAPVLEVLKETGKLPPLAEAIDAYVIDAGAEHFPDALRIVATLRRAGLSVEFSYKRAAVGKQFKAAAARGAGHAIVVGQEFSERRELAVKNLKSGKQESVALDRLNDDPRAALSSVR